MQADFKKVSQYLSELENEILEHKGTAKFEMRSDNSWFITIQFFGDDLCYIDSSWKVVWDSSSYCDEEGIRIITRIKFRLQDFGTPF